MRDNTLGFHGFPTTMREEKAVPGKDGGATFSTPVDKEGEREESGDKGARLGIQTVLRCPEQHPN